jgi:hypothetical protein
MKVIVLTDRSGQILSIANTEVRPAKGKSATREEIAAAVRMRVGVHPFNEREQLAHELELPAEFANMSPHDLHEQTRIDLSGKSPRMVRKSK